jgi:hypothetical protein
MKTLHSLKNPQRQPSIPDRIKRIASGFRHFHSVDDLELRLTFVSGTPNLHFRATVHLNTVEGSWVRMTDLDFNFYETEARNNFHMGMLTIGESV